MFWSEHRLCSGKAIGCTETRRAAELLAECGGEGYFRSEFWNCREPVELFVRILKPSETQMKDKIIKFPISAWERHKNKMGKGYVPCMISERWIQFPKQSGGHFGGGEFIYIDIMTKNTEGHQKRLCSLVVTREELQAALDAVKSPEKGTE